MDRKYLKIAPSILAADFTCLGDEARRVADSGADYMHVDIMDGNFVPNISFGPDLVAAINRSTDMFLDVHLMIYRPYDYIEKFIQAGADQITFHLEATEDVEDTLDFIRKCNVKAGLAISPETPESLLLKYLDKCDLMLLMTVHPGFGGQSFMPEVLEKIRFIRKTCDNLRIRYGGVSLKDGQDEDSIPPFDIQVDGGIDAETAELCFEAGANVLVSGTHLFKAPDMKVAVQAMRAGDLENGA